VETLRKTFRPIAATRLSVGSRALRPSAISDDGQATTILWPVDITLPAVYQIDAAGNEALVNGLMRDGAYVIEGVHPALVFKRGRAKATATRLSDADGDARE